MTSYADGGMLKRFLACLILVLLMAMRATPSAQAQVVFNNYNDMPCVENNVLDYDCIIQKTWPWLFQDGQWKALAQNGENFDLDNNLLPESIPPDVHMLVVNSEPVTAYRHWIASGHTIDFLAEQLVSYQLATSFWGKLYDECIGSLPPPDPTQPGIDCDVRHSWSGGNLWKPRSDNTGRPVFLVDADFAKAEACDVFNQDADKLLSCRFRTCCPNGGRAHFDVGRSCRDLGRDTTVVLTLNGERHCWNVSRPCSRMD